jgi:hypothetical protein
LYHKKTNIEINPIYNEIQKKMKKIKNTNYKKIKTSKTIYSPFVMLQIKN